jgi:hypothetical protein
MAAALGGAEGVFERCSTPADSRVLVASGGMVAHIGFAKTQRRNKIHHFSPMILDQVFP